MNRFVIFNNSNGKKNIGHQIDNTPMSDARTPVDKPIKTQPNDDTMYICHTKLSSTKKIIIDNNFFFKTKSQCNSMCERDMKLGSDLGPDYQV